MVPLRPGGWSVAPLAIKKLLSSVSFWYWYTIWETSSLSRPPEQVALKTKLLGFWPLAACLGFLNQNQTEGSIWAAQSDLKGSPKEPLHGELVARISGTSRSARISCCASFGRRPQTPPAAEGDGQRGHALARIHSPNGGRFHTDWISFYKGPQTALRFPPESSSTSSACQPLGCDFPLHHRPGQLSRHFGRLP